MLAGAHAANTTTTRCLGYVNQSFTSEHSVTVLQCGTHYLLELLQLLNANARLNFVCIRQ